MADIWIREAHQVTSEHVNKTVDSKQKLNRISRKTKQFQGYKWKRWKDDLGFQFPELF